VILRHEALHVALNRLKVTVRLFLSFITSRLSTHREESKMTTYTEWREILERFRREDESSKFRGEHIDRVLSGDSKEIGLWLLYTMKYLAELNPPAPV
jgi:hypothetical protein